MWFRVLLTITKSKVEKFSKIETSDFLILLAIFMQNASSIDTSFIVFLHYLFFEEQSESYKLKEEIKQIGIITFRFLAL